MPKIANDNTRVKIYKVDTESSASGPVIATQIGYAPGDQTFKEGMYLLRSDGTWVDFVALGAASDAVLWNACLFDKPGDVLRLLDSGKLDAEVFDLKLDPQALEAWLTRTAGFTAQQRIDILLSRYRERLRGQNR
jgi:hypothetical protein